MLMINVRGATANVVMMQIRWH